MKVFGTGQTPFTAQTVDIPEGDPQETTHTTDQLLNSFYGELYNLLSGQGISPTQTTGADLKQVSKSIMSLILGGSFFIDSGSANSKILTHIAGNKFLFKSLNLYGNGIVVKFVNAVQNTGAVVLTLYDAANSANIPGLTNVPLVKIDGADYTSGELKSGEIVECYYDSTTSKFITIVNTTNYNNSNVVIPTPTAPTKTVYNNSSARQLSTTYTNSNSRERYIKVYVNGTSSVNAIAGAAIYINGSSQATDSIGFYTPVGAGFIANVSAIILPGETYQVTGSSTNRFWVEWQY